MSDFLNRPLKLIATGEQMDGGQLRLGYDEDNYLDFRVDEYGNVEVVAVGDTVVFPHLNLIAESFAGDGADLDNLTADALASGTVPLARITGLTDAQIAAGADIDVTKLATGSAGQVLRVNESDEPEWGAVDPLSIVPGSEGQILQVSESGEPVWDSVEHSRLTDRDAAQSHPVTAIYDAALAISLDQTLARIFASSRRASNLALHFDAMAGLPTLNGNPVTIDGYEGLFSRASTTYAVNADGDIYDVASGAMAKHFEFDDKGRVIGSGVLLRGSRTNLVSSPDNQTTAAGWGASGGITLTANQGPFAGRLMTLVNSTAANAHTRTMTFTSSGQKGFGCLVKYVSGTMSALGLCGIWDASASVYRGRLLATSDGVGGISFSATSGATNLRVRRLADGVYWVSATANGVIHTNNNLFYGVNTAQVFSAYFAGATAVDAATIAMPYSQTASDFLRFGARQLPAAATILFDGITLGFESTGSARLWDIGELGSSSSNGRLRVVQTSSLIQSQWLSATTGVTGGSNSTTLPTYGQRIRVRTTLSSLGVVRTHTSYDFGAEASGANGVAQTLDPAWGGGAAAIIAIGSSSFPGSSADILLSSFKIAPQFDVSLADMLARV